MLESRSSAASLIPPGQFATRAWLLGQGASVHALDNALKSGKLHGLARGVLARPGLPVLREGVLASLSRVLPGPVYAGGLTALAESGLSHYVSFSARLQIYAAEPEPAWFKRLSLDFKWVWHSTARLWEPSGLLSSGSLKTVPMPWGEGEWPVASAEQAMLEIMALIPKSISFEHGDNLMQGMTSLSPRRLDLLLRACKHIQAKRLFFFFAERYRYPWFEKLDPNNYDLGSGKRSVVAGGKLDPTWLITVPEAFRGPN